MDKEHRRTGTGKKEENARTRIKTQIEKGANELTTARDNNTGAGRGIDMRSAGRPPGLNGDDAMMM